MVHCDLKSGNVIIASGGVAKIADLGIARRVRGTLPRTAAAAAAASAAAGDGGGALGSVAWMAPENADEECPDYGGPASDIYSLVRSPLFEICGSNTRARAHAHAHTCARDVYTYIFTDQIYNISKFRPTATRCSAPPPRVPAAPCIQVQRGKPRPHSRYGAFELEGPGQRRGLRARALRNSPCAVRGVDSDAD